MYSRVNYTIVGIFVLLFGAGMVAFFFWLAKYGLHQEYDLYKTYMTESVAGLSKDSVVRLRGVEVGRVKEIRIDPKDIERVEILLAIKHGIPIKADMVAHTSMLGVTGLLAIEIEGGTNQAKTLKSSNDHIPVIPSSASWFNKTKKDVGTLADRLAGLIEQTEKLLSNKNIDNVNRILDHTEVITAKGAKMMDDLNATLSAYKEALQKINADISRVADSFARVGDATLPAVKQFAQTTRNFNRVTLKVERTLDRGDYNLRKILEPILVEIEILSDQVTALAKELNQSPSDILFKSRKTRRGPGE